MIDMSKYKQEWIDLSEVNAKDKRFQSRLAGKTNEKAVAGLMESIGLTGQVSPIDIWDPQDGSKPVIICGHTRYEALSRLGWAKCLSRRIPKSDLSEKDAYNYSVTDNANQKTLSDIDMMLNCLRFHTVDALPVETIAGIVGKSKKSIGNYLLVAQGPQEIRDAIKDGKVSLSKAVLLLKSMQKEARLLVEHTRESIPSYPQASISVQEQEQEAETEAEAELDGKEKAAQAVLVGVSHGIEESVGSVSVPVLSPEEQTFQQYYQDAQHNLKDALNSENYLENVQIMMDGLQGVTDSLSSIPEVGDHIKKSVKSLKKMSPQKREARIETKIPSERIYAKPVHGGIDIVAKVRFRKDDLLKVAEFLKEKAEFIEKKVREA